MLDYIHTLSTFGPNFFYIKIKVVELVKRKLFWIETPYNCFSAPFFDQNYELISHKMCDRIKLFVIYDTISELILI